MSSETKKIILEKHFGPVIVRKQGPKSYVASFKTPVVLGAGKKTVDVPSAEATSGTEAVSLLFNRLTSGMKPDEIILVGSGKGNSEKPRKFKYVGGRFEPVGK